MTWQHHWFGTEQASQSLDTKAYSNQKWYFNLCSHLNGFQVSCYTCCCQIFHLQRHETCYPTNKLIQTKSYYSLHSNPLFHLLLSNMSFATPWNKSFYWQTRSDEPNTQCILLKPAFKSVTTCCCQMFICNAMKHVTLLTHSFRWNPTTARVQICCYTCCCQIFHLQRHETSYSTNKLVQMNPTEAHFQVCYTCCCQMFICNAMKHVTLLINPFR